MSVRLAGMWLAAGLVSACAGSARLSAFDSHFPDNLPQQQRRLEALRAAEPAVPEPSDWLLVLEGEGTGSQRSGQERQALRFVRLAEPARAFRVELAVDGLPERVGDLFVGSHAGQLLALSAADGSRRFVARLPLPHMLGAARSGQRVFVTSTDAGPRPESALTAFDADTGAVLFSHRIKGRLGAPHAHGQAVLVPFNAQFLVAVDARSGEEVARLRSTDDTFSWVRRAGSTVRFGDRRIYRLAPGYAGKHTDLATLELPTSQLPGRPPPYPNSFDVKPDHRGSPAKVGVHFLVSDGPGAADSQIAGGRMYFVFYRHVFGLDARGQPVWARALATDVVRARAAREGLAVLTAAGELLYLASDDGGIDGRVDLGTSARAARIGPLSWPATRAAPMPVAPRSLRLGLAEVAIDPDSRLVPSRSFAVKALARLQAPEITRDLLDIYEQATTPPPLKRQLAAALAERTTGADHLLRALQRRYDFLDRTRPPPFAAIVPALVRMSEQRAVPLLAAHLLDHETPLADLPLLIEGIAELGRLGAAQQAISALSRFLDLYRADRTAMAGGEALVRASLALLEVGGAQERAYLGTVASDMRTVDTLRTAILDAMPSDRRDTMAAPVRGQTRGTESRSPEVVPSRLEQADVNAAFATIADDLRACILDELSRAETLSQVRFAFMITQAGTTRARTYVPNSAEFVACVDPKVAVLRFPESRATRQLASYVVAVRAQPQADTPPGPVRGEGTWWAKHVIDDAQANTDVPPWWQAQNPFLLDVTQSFVRAPTARPAAAIPRAATSAPAPVPV
ncbi:MAG: PQQ-binding-like beta-propeller repeat protein, partial [Myxococcales bacterium]|nr:PQQ-binding-like beta-propeller repeat protein [Myxococcales bacterium]